MHVKQELKFIGQKPILAVAAVLLALFPWFIYSGITKASNLKEVALKELKEVSQPYQSNEATISENEAKAEFSNP